MGDYERMSADHPHRDPTPAPVELSANQVNALIAQQHRLWQALSRSNSWPAGAGPWRDIAKDVEVELRELLRDIGIEPTE